MKKHQTSYNIKKTSSIIIKTSSKHHLTSKNIKQHHQKKHQTS